MTVMTVDWTLEFRSLLKQQSRHVTDYVNFHISRRQPETLTIRAFCVDMDFDEDVHFQFHLNTLLRHQTRDIL